MSDRVAPPVPNAFDAEIGMLNCPTAVGVPEMMPVAVSIDRPAGKLVASKEFGELLAVIW